MKPLLKTTLCAFIVGGCAISAHGQAVVIEDDFNAYNDSGEMLEVWDVVEPPAWAPHDAEAELGTDPTDSGNNTFYGAGAEVTRPLAVTPTDENPLHVSFRLWDPVSQDEINDEEVVGLRDFAHFRTGADPLIAVGIHNAAEGNDETVYTFRNLPGDEWFDLATERNPGWNEFEVVFREDTLDVFINGGIDANGDNLAWAGGELADYRFGGNTGTDYDVHFDDASAEVIPEPGTYAAIFGALAFLGVIAYRRRHIATE